MTSMPKKPDGNGALAVRAHLLAQERRSPGRCDERHSLEDCRRICERQMRESADVEGGRADLAQGSPRRLHDAAVSVEIVARLDILRRRYRRPRGSCCARKSSCEPDWIRSRA